MKKSILSDKILEKLKKEEDKCIGCKVCMENCPMLSNFCDTPKSLLKSIVDDREIDSIIPYSCALCGYCTQVCPKSVDLKEVFYTLRKHIVDGNKGVPKCISSKAVKVHQKNSFSKLFTAKYKSKDIDKKNIVFFPGCSLMAYSPEIVMSIYKYLKEKLPKIGILLKCCGNPTYSMGEEKQFKKNYLNLCDDFNEMNVDEVIVACQNCYKTIEKNSEDILVTSLWEVIGNMGVPENVRNIGENINTTFAIHDPCPTRDKAKIHEGIRKITTQLGLKIEEFQFNKDKTLCCGSGAMLGVTNKTLAVNQMKKRANQAKSEYILTYCEECVSSMKRGGKKSIHILDLLFNEDVYEKFNFNQKDISTLKKWLNRYMGKRMIDNMKK